MFEKLEMQRDEIARYNKILQASKKQIKWFINVHQMHAGQSFGELALLNKTMRTASIRCSDECIFAIIDRDNYEKVLG